MLREHELDEPWNEFSGCQLDLGLLLPVSNQLGVRDRRLVSIASR